MPACWLANHSTRSTITVLFNWWRIQQKHSIVISWMWLILVHTHSFPVISPWLLGELWRNTQSIYINLQNENDDIEHKVVQVSSLLILLRGILFWRLVFSDSPGVANWALMCESRNLKHAGYLMMFPLISTVAIYLHVLGICLAWAAFILSIFRGLMWSQFLCHLCISSNGVINDSSVALCGPSLSLDSLLILIHQAFITRNVYLCTWVSLNAFLNLVEYNGGLNCIWNINIISLLQATLVWIYL